MQRTNPPLYVSHPIPLNCHLCPSLILPSTYHMVLAFQHTPSLTPNTNPSPEQWKGLLISPHFADQLSLVTRARAAVKVAGDQPLHRVTAQPPPFARLNVFSLSLSLARNYFAVSHSGSS